MGKPYLLLRDAGRLPGPVQLSCAGLEQGWYPQRSHHHDSGFDHSKPGISEPPNCNLPNSNNPNSIELKDLQFRLPLNPNARAKSRDFPWSDRDGLKRCRVLQIPLKPKA